MGINKLLIRIVGIVSITLILTNCKGSEPNDPTPKRVEVTSISLSQTSAEMFVGDVLLLSASVLPQNATEKTISWSSDRSDIATVDNQGKVTAISPGSVMVKAFAGGVSSACQITVIAKTVSVTSVTVSPETLSLTEGETAALKATVLPENADNKAVKWSSSDETIASVDDNGNVTANGVGTADITVTTDDGGKQATCTVTVQKAAVHVTSVSISPESLTITEGETATLVATVLPEDADNKAVKWSSSDETIASVDDNGNVTANGVGTADITVTTDDGGEQATCTVIVQKAVVPVTSVSISPESLTITEGETATLVATVLPEDADNKAVKWSSSNETIASVDDNGNVTANGVGTADITVTTDDGGKQATCTVTVQKAIHVTSVTINPESFSLIEGETVILTATVLPEDADDKTVQWSSSDKNIASVNKGEVTAHKAGTATITVTTNDGEKKATCIITVTDTFMGNHQGTSEEEW